MERIGSHDKRDRSPSQSRKRSLDPAGDKLPYPPRCPPRPPVPSQPTALPSATRTPSITASPPRAGRDRHRPRPRRPPPGHRRTRHPPPEQASQPTPAPDTIAFDRIARTLRRTIALARTLTDPAPQTPPPRARTSAASPPASRSSATVEDTIQRETSGAEADALHAEFYERLDAPDLDDDLDHLPVADIIASIRRDLGIANLPGTHPWKRRTPQDVRELCARAAGRQGGGQRRGSPREQGGRLDQEPAFLPTAAPAPPAPAPARQHPDPAPRPGRHRTKRFRSQEIPCTRDGRRPVNAPPHT